MLPSGPAVMSVGWLAAVGTAYSVTVLAESMRAILLPLSSVNHRLPSAPFVMSVGALLAVMPVPVSVIVSDSPYIGRLPILSLVAADSANRTAPHGPAVMPLGDDDDVGVAMPLIADVPSVASAPILL